MEILLNLTRMARRLGVTKVWLRDQADAGRVPHLKAGKAYIFSASAVEAAIARLASEQPAGGDAHAS